MSQTYGIKFDMWNNHAFCLIEILSLPQANIHILGWLSGRQPWIYPPDSNSKFQAYSPGVGFQDFAQEVGPEFCPASARHIRILSFMHIIYKRNEEIKRESRGYCTYYKNMAMAMYSGRYLRYSFFLPCCGYFDCLFDKKLPIAYDIRWYYCTSVDRLATGKSR